MLIFCTFPFPLFLEDIFIVTTGRVLRYWVSACLHQLNMMMIIITIIIIIFFIMVFIMYHGKIENKSEYAPQRNSLLHQKL